eukprot:TRINITY_DN7230_c0_g1_i4.p1 TRINITY_DN7230_c0_g1~~TRINITY_DN7230_c0_g1_i4.p1  ORF type:complete len:1171 (-),score=189.12 TRINITY_DN7230_c0_g1_i4:173-3412(-)
MAISATPSMRRVSSKTSGSRRISICELQSDGPQKGSPVQIDSLWRDLYIANEAIAEEQESVSQRGKRPSQFSRSTSGSVALPGPRNTILHPDGRFRIAWDFIGGLLVVWDCIMIPLSSAWSSDMGPSSPDFPLFILALLYWTLDIVFNFRTGVYEEGHLIMQPYAIAVRYMQTWMLFDFMVVGLDYLVLLIVLVMRSSNIFRIVRLLRMGRMIRVAKMVSASNLSRKLDDMGAGSGMTVVVIALTIAKLLFSIFMIAHLLACCWYYIGISAFETSPEESWLSLEDEASKQFAQVPNFVQYTRSLHWVLALMTTNTNDAIIHPLNEVERIFAIATVFSSILILGSSASKLASDLSALNRMNAEVDDTRNKLQRHLGASRVPLPLRARILKFALHALRRRTAMVLDSATMALLSEQLQSELIVCQRKEHVQIHPLFSLIGSSHPEAMLSVCNAFTLNLYNDNDVLFIKGARARQIYVTRSGCYRLQNDTRIAPNGPTMSPKAMPDRQISSDDKHADGTDFEEPHWFAELSLFSDFMHQSTLRAMSFGEAFTLTAKDFAYGISNFPCCVVDVFRYAQAYLSKTWTGSSPPNGHVLATDSMPLDISEKACIAVYSAFEVVRLSDLPACPQAVPDMQDEVLSALKTGSMSSDELLEKLPMAFTELSEDNGCYTILELADERKRSLTAVMCAYWMLHDDYESFTQVQPESSRMTKKLWAGWQEVVSWALTDNDVTHAMMVFLAIKGIGKAKVLSSSRPGALKGSPEDNVLYYLDTASKQSSLVPSFFNLDSNMQELLKSALEMHSQFNLAQMLQGENNPSHVAILQKLVLFEAGEGQALLKFYIMNLVCMMSALRGVETRRGSLFLDEKNGASMLMGIKCLQQLAGASPQAVYWSFVEKRARSIGLSCQTQEELAAARLSCLIRASAADRSALQETWTGLPGADRRILTDFFLADGLQERAYMLTFLPLYFANSKSNKSVGLRLALTVLVDLLDMMKAAGCDKVIEGTGATIRVDISDVAAYAKEVKAPRAFEAIPAYTKLEEIREGMKLVVSFLHWQRVGAQGWQQEPHEMYVSMRKIERNMVS